MTYRIDNHSHPAAWRMYRECFHDTLAFAGTLFAVGAESDAAPDTERVASDRLFDADWLAGPLARYGRENRAAEPRAVASQWSKFAFARLIIPTVVLQASLDRAIDFSTTPWQVEIGDDGTPARFLFAAAPLARPGGGDYASLIDHAMMPMIAALQRGFGLAPRVYASNAAMYFTWALDQLDRQARGQAEPLAAARALNHAPTRPDGGQNPFHAPYKALAPGARDGNGDPARECRRLCCVRDLDPAWDLCSNCPRAITYTDADTASA